MRTPTTRVEQRVVKFFCAGAGGLETYSGKDMLATHRDMNVREQAFVTVFDDAMAAPEANGMTRPQEQALRMVDCLRLAVRQEAVAR